MHDVILRAVNPPRMSDLDRAAQVLEALAKPPHLRLAEDALTAARNVRAEIATRHRAAGIRAREAGSMRDDDLNELTNLLAAADRKIVSARGSLREARASFAPTFREGTKDLRASAAQRLEEIAAMLADTLAVLDMVRKSGERVGVELPFHRAGTAPAELRQLARSLGAK
jgi:hypothetical protein